MLIILQQSNIFKSILNFSLTTFYNYITKISVLYLLLQFNKIIKDWIGKYYMCRNLATLKSFIFFVLNFY